MPDPQLIQVTFELIRKSRSGLSWYVKKGDITACVPIEQIYDREYDNYAQFQTVSPEIPVWLAKKTGLI